MSCIWASLQLERACVGTESAEQPSEFGKVVAPHASSWLIMPPVRHSSGWGCGLGLWETHTACTAHSTKLVRGASQGTQLVSVQHRGSAHGDMRTSTHTMAFVHGVRLASFHPDRKMGAGARHAWQVERVCINITRHATRSPGGRPTPEGQSSNGEKV